jgi:p-cumate 2,3-dioxygenase alpha subunit
MEELERLIIDDPERGLFRVHRSAFTSPEIFRLERERIFDRCWLYLGHESEVQHPGDFIRRWVGGRPLFMIRDDEGEPRVFYNTCPHRGALICRRDVGNSKVLQCFYHAWTFNTRGRLIGLPEEGRYSPGFDREERSLRSPRYASYRGFVFVTFNPQAPSLEEYLAGAREILDIVADQAEQGMKVLRGTHRYHIRANWKLLVENTIDMYHFPATHETYVEYIKMLERTRSGNRPRPVAGPERALPLGNGHTVYERRAPGGRPVADWHPLQGEEVQDEIEQVKARVIARVGEERGRRICELGRNFIFFPNMAIVDTRAVNVRVWNPIRPDYMEVMQFQLVPREESGLRLQRRLEAYLSFFGPGGLATPDDIEALESCQAGFMAGGVEYNDISLGYGTQEGLTELAIRVFWRQWHALIRGLERPERWDDPAPVPATSEVTAP